MEGHNGRGGGVSRDPQFVLRNKWTAPYFRSGDTFVLKDNVRSQFLSWNPIFSRSQLCGEMERKIAVIAFQGFPIMDFYFSQPQKNVNYFGTFIPNITSQK